MKTESPSITAQAGQGYPLGHIPSCHSWKEAGRTKQSFLETTKELWELPSDPGPRRSKGLTTATTQGARALITEVRELLKFLPSGRQTTQYLPLLLRTQWQTKMRFPRGSLWETSECIRPIYRAMGEELKGMSEGDLKHPSWMMTPLWVCRRNPSPIYINNPSQGPQAKCNAEFHATGWEGGWILSNGPIILYAPPSKRQGQQSTSCQLFWSLKMLLSRVENGALFWTRLVLHMCSYHAGIKNKNHFLKKNL